MTNRQSSAFRRTIPASDILGSLASDLSQIRSEDRLTFADLGRVLGKSEDQAAKYCDGTAEMGVVAYYFAKQAWNGRFTGRADNLIFGAPDATDDRRKHSSILRASLAISLMLEDETIDESEVRDNRKTLEEARDAIDKILSRVAPRSVA